MKAAMRASLKECLGDVKRSLKGKRMASSYGRKAGEDELSRDSDGSETGSGSVEGNSRGTPGAEKALERKVVSGESEAREEMQESGDWRHEEMKEFMKKKAAPKVQRESGLRTLAAKVRDSKKKG